MDEALRLMEASKDSLEIDGGERDRDADQTDTTKIYRLIKDMASLVGAPRAGRRMGRGPGGERDMEVDEDDDDGQFAELAIVDIRARVLAAGFNETQLMDTIFQVCILRFYHMASCY